MSFSYEELREQLLARPGSSSGYPFGEGTLVFKVAGKMFALLAEDERPLRINLKCDPEDALALCKQHGAVLPGYHMNKKHWNTLVLDGSLPDELVRELIDHSYALVVAALSKKAREELQK